MKEKRAMSIKELAELLGVNTDTVRRAVRRGVIPSTREETASRFDWEKVRQGMKARAQEVTSQQSKMASEAGGDSRPHARQKPPHGKTGAQILGDT